MHIYIIYFKSESISHTLRLLINATFYPLTLAILSKYVFYQMVTLLSTNLIRYFTHWKLYIRYIIWNDFVLHLLTYIFNFTVCSTLYNSTK